MKFRFNLQKKFWTKVNVSITINDCWEWTQYKDKDGYGTFYFDGTSLKAHRYVYELYYGKIPQNYCVCHECDNPPCLNPLHLFLGTHLQNMTDMKLKNRSRNSLGSQNTNTNLTEQVILSTLNLVLLGKLKTKKDIINFNNNFTFRNIENILRKQNWSHITNIFNINQWDHIKDTLNGYITRYTVECIMYDIKVNNLNNLQLSEKYNIDKYTISGIRNNKHKYTKR
jgi:hypothetical protein